MAAQMEFYRRKLAAEMNSDVGKVFLGGVSWETTAEKLRDYFRTYGTVVESVVMRDRVTGRGRGFGFVIFNDPTVADQVVTLKHIIDGRQVEAKKAIPREEQKRLARARNAGTSVFCQLKADRKKIFVGGLAASATEDDIRKYFSQFGAVKDVVIVCTHTTQKSRGFGFITFHSEDTVELVLEKTFHTMKSNERMVEVKRAIPKVFFSDVGRMYSSLNTVAAPEMYAAVNGCSYGLNYGPFSPTGYGSAGGFAFGMNQNCSGIGFNNSTPASLRGLGYGAGYGSTSYAVADGGDAVGYGSFMPGILGRYGNPPILPNSPAWGCGGAGLGSGYYSGFRGSIVNGTGHGGPAQPWRSGGTEVNQNAGTKCGLMTVGFTGSENVFDTSPDGYGSGGSEFKRSSMQPGNTGFETFQISSSVPDERNHINDVVLLRGSSSSESESPARKFGMIETYNCFAASTNSTAGGGSYGGRTKNGSIATGCAREFAVSSRQTLRGSGVRILMRDHSTIARTSESTQST